MIPISADFWFSFYFILTCSCVIIHLRNRIQILEIEKFEEINSRENSVGVRTAAKAQIKDKE